MVKCLLQEGNLLCKIDLEGCIPNGTACTCSFRTQEVPLFPFEGNPRSVYMPLMGEVQDLPWVGGYAKPP